MTHLLRVATVGLLCLPLAANAGPLRDDVLALLNGYEDVPTAADFAALGDGAAAELMEIAEDHGVASSRRSRAISSLQHFPRPEVRTFLESHLDQADKGILRRKAAMALGAGFAADAVPLLKAHLDDEDPMVRVAVVQGLQLTEAPAAREVLDERLQVESNDTVKAAITRALEAK